MDVKATRASGEFLTLSDGHRIWYRFVPGTGPAVVLLHGIGGSSYPLRRLAAPIEAHGRPSLLVDLRGHGFSDGPMAGGGFTLPEHVEDVLAVLDYLEVGYADLVGHCFGAMIAVRIAAMRPALARRLVLVSGTTRPRDGLRAAVCWGAIGAVGSIFAAVAPRSYHARLQEQFDAAVFSRVSDLYPPRMRQDFRHTSYRNAVATMMAMSRVDLAKDAASLALPVLVVHGRRDVYVPWRNARASAQQIPGSRFVLRETDGHVSCVLGAQSTLARDVAEFLAL